MIVKKDDETFNLFSLVRFKRLLWVIEKTNKYFRKKRLIV
ncbi:hypothetical protein ACIRA0001_1024 [Acinetobacter radioresistens SK82]|uniref:Uncharacterized protein n=1 Tax=Acinetobacter radioresistens SK82 TaxID=596318 RepID=A0ABP2GNI9_ACIRA|nr:hypothetical protein ACIRA0001_1024 [Acinetobacter radioresistens SK82]EXB87507.1 hypothetical protein J538_0699 [Acinetobacter sp. 272263]EXC33474.1 hypothetical protein J520_0941 [Acinetobacter sp. 869535]EXE57751.1 hypothetical protein J579_1700 [Acinetobacter sp. 1239920]